MGRFLPSPLDRLFSKIDDRTLQAFCPLPIDRWTASSLLQKAIRRSDTAMALRAAATLHAADTSTLWRRLLAIAFEDVGIGDPAVVIAVAGVCGSAKVRTPLGSSVAVAAAVTSLLAEAIKDRSSDYLICAAYKHPSLAGARLISSAERSEARLAMVSDCSLDPVRRAVAIWHASGLAWRETRPAPGGNLLDLLDTLRDMRISAELVSATAIAARRVRDPIVVMVPLLADLVGRSATTSAETALPPAEIDRGLPLYALDQHTRSGRQANARLVARSAPIRALVEKHVPRSAWAKVAGVAAFYIDGAPITPRLNWRLSSNLETLGIEADLLPLGVPKGLIPELLAAVSDNLPLLNALRREVRSEAA